MKNLEIGIWIEMKKLKREKMLLDRDEKEIKKIKTTKIKIFKF